MMKKSKVIPLLEIIIGSILLVREIYDFFTLPSLYNDNELVDYSKYKDTYIKLIVVTKQDPYLFDLMLDAFYKAGVLDVSIVEDFSDVLLEEDDDEVDQAEDTMTILNKYIDNMKLDVDNNKLKSHMRELYVEALNLQRTE